MRKWICWRELEELFQRCKEFLGWGISQQRYSADLICHFPAFKPSPSFQDTWGSGTWGSNGVRYREGMGLLSPSSKLRAALTHVFMVMSIAGTLEHNVNSRMPLFIPVFPTRVRAPDIFSSSFRHWLLVCQQVVYPEAQSDSKLKDLWCICQILFPLT